MIEPEYDHAQLPGHEQAAAFWVGAMIATQAIAVYIDADRSRGPFGASPDFDALPARLKVRILEACEAEFKRQRIKLLRESLKIGDPTVADLASMASDPS